MRNQITFGHSKQDCIELEEGICPNCKKQVDLSTLLEDRNRREFESTGLCQECQDKLYGGE